MVELKHRTRECHRELEAQIAMEQALSSLDGYRCLLQKFRAIYSAFEPQLMRVPDLNRWVLDLPERQHIPHLLADLRTLNSLPNHETACISTQINNVPEALGCLYVLEGSTLGGQIITRQVAEHLGLRPDHGCQFFSGAGRNTADLWRAFALAMEAFAAAEPDLREQIVQSALSTFDAFRSSFAAKAPSPAVAGSKGALVT